MKNLTTRRCSRCSIHSRMPLASAAKANRMIATVIMSSLCASDMSFMIMEPRPCLGCEHLAQQHAEQRYGEADAQAGEHFGQRGGEQHGRDGLPGRKLQRARGAQIDLRNGADRAHGEQRDRQYAVQRAERHFAGNAEPEDQQHDRIEHDLRQRIERDQDRLADRAGNPMRAHPDADGKADARRRGARQGERQQRRRRVGRQSVRSRCCARDKTTSAAARAGRSSRRSGAAPARPRARPATIMNVSVARRARGHVRPPLRRAAKRMSSACSPALTTVAMIRRNRISAYMRRLLKSA